jgi:hypothetical protein
MLRSILALVVCLAALPILCGPAWADDTPTFFADPATGCRLGSFYPQQGLVPHWSGKCVGGFAEGPGIVEWQVNGQFDSHNEGGYHAGLREGMVINVNPQGSRFEGAYHNGRLNGRCIATYRDGTRIDGHCVNDQITGKGTETLASGDRYEGDFVNAGLTGRGVYTWKSGQRYEGDFVDGVRTGRGRQVIAEDERYEGDWVADKYEGTGTYSFADGGVYEGEWTNDLPNRRGVFHGFLDGDPHDFAGTWVNGCFAQAPYTAELFKSRAECGFDD